ncbi:MAG: histidine kinase [Rhodocyclaceae bacterium]|nr:histidine kinase [Rhodocyclaceae bacterium]MCL4725225.1 histidine kinase [Rhodocyclaceae bacterium]OQY66606.1 MAG: sensor histidine kinase [Rhodocyclaceae bacterium UTPRO2]
MLRCLLGVNLLALFAALARNTALARLPEELVELAALVEPPLIASVALLYAAGRPLARLPYAAALAAVMLASAALAALFMALFTPPGLPPPSPLRAALWAAAAAAAVLLYFDLRHRAFSPALTEARLMALTARIRPHFLFNSLNAVLGVIRSDPRRAEQALEELSDLFRVLMAENKQLVTLGEEIALCRQYLDLEHLRLGERLRVAWDIEGCPADAQVPPLMLQPLLENAVYHGIEPCTEPATVTIRAERAGEEIRIVLSNPYHGENAHHAGNRMALDNIRERLMLFYDLEARLDTEAQEGLFRATIRLPYRRGGST